MARTQVNEPTEQEVEVPQIGKARIWWAVLYLENMISGWQDLIGDILELPYAYCIHDKDVDKDGVIRKPHIHLIIVFSNTTTYKHALQVFQQLGAKACNTCKAVIKIRSAYDYLIHNTETCKKTGKHLYDESERITGNNFDIGAYEQLSLEDKLRMLDEIIDFVIDNPSIMDMPTFYVGFRRAFRQDYLSYFQVATTYNAQIRSLVGGNYLIWKRRIDIAKASSEEG